MSAAVRLDFSAQRTVKVGRVVVPSSVSSAAWIIERQICLPAGSAREANEISSSVSGVVLLLVPRIGISWQGPPMSVGEMLSASATQGVVLCD